jgi:hypothetical protein
MRFAVHPVIDSPLDEWLLIQYILHPTPAAVKRALYASWLHANNGKGNRTGRIEGLASRSDTGADHHTVSYTYPLSKRTLTYVGYSGLHNETRASYNYNINPYPRG